LERINLKDDELIPFENALLCHKKFIHTLEKIAEELLWEIYDDIKKENQKV